jgi:PAS domain S-box-containing protein
MRQSDLFAEKSNKYGFQTDANSPGAVLRALNFLTILRARAPWWSGFVGGVLLVAVGVLVRVAILGPGSESLAYLTFWPVVMVAALVGGVPAGATAVLLSALLVHAVFVPLRDFADWLGLGVFLLGGGFIVGVTELLLRSRLQALAAVETQAIKAHLAAIVESSDDPILSKDLNGTILSWNAAASRLFGYDSDEIVGRPITVLIPPNLVAEESGIIARLKNGERIEHYETARVAKGGRVIDVALTVSPIRDSRGAVVGASKIIRDISEKKRAEQGLRAAQQRVELATKTTGVGVWEWNVKTNVIIWDAQMFRIYGVDPTPDGAAGYEVWASTVLPEDLPRQEELLRLHASQGSGNRREFRIRRKDSNETRVIEAVETLRYDAHGDIESFVGTNLDVTENRRAEKALRLSQDHLRHAADAARLTHVQFDLKNSRVQLAGNFQEVVGYQPRTPPEGGALEGARAGLLSHVAEPDRPTVSSMFDDIFAGVRGKHRFRVIGDDGATRWFESVAGSDSNREGKVSRVFATLLDITSLVEGQTALESAKAKADEILASIGDGFYALDSQWRFSYFNPRAEEMLGRKCDDVIGRSFFDVFPMVKGTPVHANYKKVMDEDRALKFEMISPVMKRWVAFSVYPTHEGGISVYFQDVEQQKAAEKDLVAAKAEAERANLAKSKFLASASHDLRQPVQSLVLLLSLIERQVKDNPKAISTTQMMKQALGGLNGLLTAILDISRLDAGVVHAEPQLVDLAALLGRLASEYGAKAEAKGLKLRFVPSRLQTFVDPSLVERALRNFIENALRYTAEGTILIGVRRRGERVRIDVVDTGIGIAEDRKADIFEEFVQVDNPGRDLGLGLGLGLAIVARLAAVLGAEIDFDSKIGRGSRFSLFLPQVQAVASAKPADQEVRDAGGRLLVVEDNYILLQCLENMAQTWGYETIVADSGEEALEKAAAAEWRIDGIVSDNRLGAGLTGVETSKEIRRRAGRAIPTLILTGDTAAERISEIKSCGFELLHKPVSDHELRSKIAAMIFA